MPATNSVSVKRETLNLRIKPTERDLIRFLWLTQTGFAASAREIVFFCSEKRCSRAHIVCGS